MKRVLSVTVALVVMAALALPMHKAIAAGGPAGNSTSVLILGSSVDGSPSMEEAAVLASYPTWTINVCTDAEWAAMSTADFMTYRALIIGDPHCGFVSSAAANPSLNGAISGNVLIIGTDPVFHADYAGNAGAANLIQKGMDFVLTNSSGRTAAYFTISCGEGGASAGTPVPLLDSAFGGGYFTVVGQGGCPNDCHIIDNSHPALSGLTNADLSNWNCSAHLGFDSYTAPNFQPLVMTTDIAGSFSFVDIEGDTLSGTPYIVARGVQCPDLPTITVSLSPTCLWPANHTMATITATISTTGTNTSVTLVSVTSSQADNGLGDGDTANDIQGATTGTDDRSFQLRKERSANINSGRTYTATYRVTDECGQTAEASATVFVPHHGGCP